jgi:hypothetical protein
MKPFLTLLTLIVIYQNTSANPIQNIRKEYQLAKNIQEARKASSGELQATQISMVRNIPGLGPCQTQIDFFGSENLTTDEELTHPWKHNGSIHLKFVSVHYNLAAYPVTLEYLYNDENQLVFHFLKDESRQTEERYYFHEQQLFKLILSHSVNTPEQSKVEKQGNFQKEEVGKSKQLQQKAKEYLSTYRNIHLLEKLEKQ